MDPCKEDGSSKLRAVANPLPFPVPLPFPFPLPFSFSFAEDPFGFPNPNAPLTAICANRATSTENRCL